MLRAAVVRHTGLDPEFKPRGSEPGRLENFSDAVFGMAITLLLISTSPPTTFEQIKRFTYELPPFMACITLIVLIWHQHFIFYLRYGLRNVKMVALNTIFLVIILFYVYPLKFLTRLIIIGPLSYLMDEKVLLEEISEMIHFREVGQLMIIYAIGAASVFLVLALMYRYAYSQAADLELTEIERFDTRVSIWMNLLMAAVPILSGVLAAILHDSQWAGPVSGFAYFLYTPIMFIFSARMTRQRKRLLDSTGVDGRTSPDS